MVAMDHGNSPISLYFYSTQWCSREIFALQKGVRQGDPMSPLLFVLAAELLQYIVNKACQQGLQMAIPSRHGSVFPIIQYVDDTIIIMKASE
jgi:hypothetical protein